MRRCMAGFPLEKLGPIREGVSLQETLSNGSKANLHVEIKLLKDSLNIEDHRVKMPQCHRVMLSWYRVRLLGRLRGQSSDRGLSSTSSTCNEEQNVNEEREAHWFP